MHLLRVVVAGAALLAALPAFAQTPAAAAAPVSGEAVYKQRCAACHDTGAARTPRREALQQMTAARIRRTLDFGAMMTIAYPMRQVEREAVANYLGKPGGEAGPKPEAFCADRTVRIGDLSRHAWNGWSPARDNTRFVPADLAGLTAGDVPRLKLKWAFGFEGDISAFGQPTVVGDQMFVGSAGGVVHALRTSTGCLQWVFQANGPIRSGIVVAPVDGRHVLLFGDLTGWFYALDAADGKLIWSKRPEVHEAVRLSAPPVVYNGLVLIPVASWEETRSLNAEYPCCTFRGSITALRLRDGSEAWKTFTVPRRGEVNGKTSVGTPTIGPSGVGVWASPTIDMRRGRMYITTGNNYSTPPTDTSDAVMALDLNTGAIVWTRQALANDVYNSACASSPTRGPSCPEENGPDHDFGSPALLVRTAGGRELLLAGQKSGVVWAFDPDKNGEVVWQTRVGKGGINGGVQWGMASDGELVFAQTSDAAITRTATARVLDPKTGGGLSALRVVDGSRAWYAEPPACKQVANCSPAQSAALTAIPGVVFSGSMDGHLRAYSAREGKVIWEFDTVREYKTVNGVTAKGGAIDGPGAIVVNGMVFVNSGYTRQGGMAGNVLLAFAPGD
jgi:polyvinyl alcohol dehydrogenase (cytochrome)